MLPDKDMNSEISFPPAENCRFGGHFEIAAMARYLPDNVKTTAKLIDENGIKLKDTIVTRATGVQRRHIADPSHSDSDILAVAARECLKQGQTSVDTLSRIFVNKLLGDRILPPTSAMMQRKLNANVALQCMDIDGGSGGFLQALLMANRCLEGGDDAILIASGGVHQKLMNPQDSRTAYLFGDAATALLLKRSEKKHLLAHYEFSNHTLAALHHGVDFYHFAIKYLHGGDLDLFEMGNLKDAESYYQHATQHTMDTLLAGANCTADDIDMFFVSQMSLPLWQTVVTHLHLPEEKLVSVLPHTGNTLSANIPLQLIEWQIRQSESGVTDLTGKRIMMIALGEGFLGGGCIYQF